VSAAEFWASQNGVRHITPQGKPNPEGAWLGQYLSDVASHGRVLEFGCGPGRISCGFDPESYIGVDINPRAIEYARERNPAHRFEVVGDELPDADVCLFHTVLMHIPDEDLVPLLKRIRAPVIYVSEMLGRHRRREGDPPVFNREIEDYEDAFGAIGYGLISVKRRIYEHYGEPMGLMQFIQSGD
jgi:SAM-dependent methyltransferase